MVEGAGQAGALQLPVRDLSGAAAQQLGGQPDGLGDGLGYTATGDEMVFGGGKSIRDGRIVAVGKSGNPDVMDGVHPNLHIGPSTDVIAGEGRILTAGAIDTHLHFLSEIEMLEALATGTTTVTGGGYKVHEDWGATPSPSTPR